MRIQHNILAMNSYRNYTNNTSALGKNLERLSSGYKINRAGDDAAGLAISEKMRAQITGLEAAQKNVKDGISLVKTGEGAMQEIQDMLNRMDYLATQSANGTYDDETDRDALQKEVNQLKEEINRIADSANFNGINLLDGSLDASAAGGTKISANVIQVQKQGVSSTEAKVPSFKVDLNGIRVQATQAGTVELKVTIANKTFTFKKTGAAKGDILKASDFVMTAAYTGTIDGFTFKATVNGTFTVDTGAASATLYSNATGEKLDKILNSEWTVTVKSTVTKGKQLEGSTYNNRPTVIQYGLLESAGQAAKASFALTAAMLKNGAKITIGTTTYTIDYDSTATSGTTIGVKKLLVDDKLNSDMYARVADMLTKAASGNSMFDVGANGTTITVVQKDTAASTADTNQTKTLYTKDDILSYLSFEGGGEKSLQLQIGDTAADYNQLHVSIGDMHTSALGIADLNISTAEDAADAIDTIRDAINLVSSVRGDLGAYQNRLEHTQNNLSVMAENIQDAESTIRDTDVAEEMMSYVKNNILVQSAQAMLAQANQVPQGVLQLLG